MHAFSRLLQIVADMCWQDQPGCVVCSRVTTITNDITVCKHLLPIAARAACDSKLYCCRELSWEAATERMLDAAEMGPGDWPKAATKVAEATLFSAYNAALGMPCPWAFELLCQPLCFCGAQSVGCRLQHGSTGSHPPCSISACAYTN